MIHPPPSHPQWFQLQYQDRNRSLCPLKWTQLLLSASAVVLLVSSPSLYLLDPTLIVKWSETSLSTRSRVSSRISKSSWPLWRNICVVMGDEFLTNRFTKRSQSDSGVCQSTCFSFLQITAAEKIGEQMLRRPKGWLNVPLNLFLGGDRICCLLRLRTDSQIKVCQNEEIREPEQLWENTCSRCLFVVPHLDELLTLCTHQKSHRQQSNFLIPW